ncbi:Pam16 domain containing protein [Asbolus verrucosus]|uniref:Pam16 domain containing protein n=1 Tax=Asbolus verrucosus TaxID=1661398 RepID=A0A482W0C9_ASBVE|nr:Pam16 domain containing protein [Asbolus verrucosus]
MRYPHVNPEEADDTSKHDITLNEAMRILDIDKLDPLQVEKRFKYLFELNSKSSGGSFYLQSKIFRAKQRLDSEIQKQIA